MLKTCEHKPCSKQFEANRKDKKYCSQACRTKDSLLRAQVNSSPGSPTEVQTPKPQAELFDKPVPRMEISKPEGLNFQMQYVFDSQKKEIERWEKQFNEEREKRKKLAEEKAKLATELAELKTDQRIAEYAKPSGLAGFMDNPLIKEMSPHIGPVLAGIVERMLTPAPAIAPTTIDGVTDETAQWVTAQPAGVQNALRTLIAEVAKLAEPEKIIAALERFKNQLQKTTGGAPFIVNGGTVRATGSGFGM